MRASDPAPEVSIVVPAYNCERWLDSCLESLSRQTLQEREIIVVDDGSTDATGAIAERWSRTDPTLRVLRKQNGGCASARSTGLHAARGRYVGFVDADDWTNNEMFMKLLLLAKEHNAEIAQVGFWKVFRRDLKKERYDDQLGDSVQFLDGIPARIRYHLLMAQPSIWRRIYRKDFLQKHGIDFPVEIRNYDDLTFQFEAMMAVRSFAATSEPFYFYRLGHPEQSMSIQDKRLFAHFALFDYLRKRHELRSDPLIWKCFKRAQFNSHIWSRSLLRPEFRVQHEQLAASDIFDVGNSRESCRVLAQLLAYTLERGPATLWALKCWLIYLRNRSTG